MFGKDIEESVSVIVTTRAGLAGSPRHYFSRFFSNTGMKNPLLPS